MPKIAVIDVETTGFNAFRSDRIIEIAVVVLDAQSGIVKEFVSLINPERDVGPTRIHGITASHVTHAPRFPEIADQVFDAMCGAVAIAGHNVSFDRSFIQAETERCGHRFPAVPSLCTMRLSGGGTLEEVCCDYEVSRPKVAHSALDDARATASLLQRILRENDALKASLSNSSIPIQWPPFPRTGARPVTRDCVNSRTSSPNTYLQKLSRRVHTNVEQPSPDPSPAIAYAALLTQALKDNHIDDQEAKALIDLADHWNLTSQEIVSIHRQFMMQLEIAALADGIVTEQERSELRTVALLLGLNSGTVESDLDSALAKITSSRNYASFTDTGSERSFVVPDMKGKTVCFTGESLCRVNGEFVSRSMAMSLAEKSGIMFTDSMTKRVDMLVVADPHTQSGKAQKARKYGIPIMPEFDFWRSLGVNVE
jgi:DNA polymerase III subunit epsilon